MLSLGQGMEMDRFRGVHETHAARLSIKPYIAFGEGRGVRTGSPDPEPDAVVLMIGAPGVSDRAVRQARQGQSVHGQFLQEQPVLIRACQVAGPEADISVGEPQDHLPGLRTFMYR